MPRPRAKNVETDDKDDKEEDPEWDSNERNLMLYLLKLKRWLPKQHPQFNNFIRYGFIINGRQEVVVFDKKQQTDLQSGDFAAGRFEHPCNVGLGTDEDEDSEDEEGDAASTTQPLSARKIRPIPATITSTTPGLRGTGSEEFKIAPKALQSFDEELCEKILTTVRDEDTADELLNDCENSARALLYMLHQRANKISTTDDSNVEARADSLYREGIATASVKAFNEFKSKYRAFNLARLAPKPDKQLANDYIQVVNRLGENIEGRLDAKLWRPDLLLKG